MKRTTLLILILAILSSGALLPQAEPSQGETLDKIVSIVGNEIIMKSDLDGQIMLLASQSTSIDIKNPELRRKILDEMINEKLVITKAIEDSIEVTEDEVEQYWNRLLQEYKMMYGSFERIEAIFGMSISRLKYQYKEEIKKKILYSKIRQKKFGEIKCSPREVQEFFTRFKDSLKTIPSQVELYHIVRNVTANLVAKEEIYSLAKKVRDSLVAGGDFTLFAARYSGHTSTANTGGDFGWAQRGITLHGTFPEIETVAFALEPGQISQPVESPVGLHIIQTLEKNKDSVHFRHIIFKFGRTSEDIKATKDFLLGLKKRAEAGEEFEQLAKTYSDDADTRGFGGLIGNFDIKELITYFNEEVDKLPVGSISNPMPFSLNATSSGYRIVYKKRQIPEHFPSLTTDYKEIEKYAVNYKQIQEYQTWIAALRKEMYFEKKE